MKTSRSPLPVLGTVLAGVLLLPAAALHSEEDITSSARKVFAEYQDSVVSISAVAKITVSFTTSTGPGTSQPENEQKIETTGTLIDPSGLVVAALSTLDPADAMNGREMDTPRGRVTVNASSKMKEVKITLGDGTEIPADIVLRDADLDLAFVRLKMDSKEAKGVTLKTVDLKAGSKASVLDELVVLGRTDEGFNRRPCVVTDLIVAELKKPRQFFKINCPWNGVPVFQKDGKVIGINVNRLTKGMRGSNAVLPAEDIVPIAEQALKARAEEPKPDAAPAAAAKPETSAPAVAPAASDKK